MPPALTSPGDRLLVHLATLGPVGYAPKAPGTLGTLVAVAALALIRPSGPLYIALLAGSIVLAVAASSSAERAFEQKDSQKIVIDEFAGYLTAMAFVPISAGYLAASFILFRIFDILKPPPVRNLQFLRGGAGVVADDIAAGIMANVVLQAWRLLATT